MKSLLQIMLVVHKTIVTKYVLSFVMLSKPLLISVLLKDSTISFLKNKLGNRLLIKSKNIIFFIVEKMKGRAGLHLDHSTPSHGWQIFTGKTMRNHNV